MQNSEITRTNDIEELRHYLDNISLELGTVIETTNVNKAAFRRHDIFSDLEPEDVAGTFELISERLKNILDEIVTLTYPAKESGLSDHGADSMNED